MKVTYICEDGHCEGEKCRLTIYIRGEMMQEEIVLPAYCPFFFNPSTVSSGLSNRKECIWKIEEFTP